jgi:hypothetical protein
MKKSYALFTGNKIIKISEQKEDVVNCYNNLSQSEKQHSFIAEKFIAGSWEYQQSHWMFDPQEDKLL